MDPLFVADSVGVTFGTRDVLKSATAWASPGKVTVLLGRNGSGKTTLLKASVGLIPMRFGSARFAGEVHVRPRLACLARRGLFFQPATETLSRRHTLRWQFEVMGHQTGQAFPWGLVERLGLGGVLDQTPFEISGGEARKACIALALARKPRCLLADEPLSGIAPRDQEEVAKGIGALAAGGAAVMVTGHEVEPLLDLAHEVIWMVAGTTHGLGAPEVARSHAQFQREYLAGRWA
jgi:ABC-type multidrug transport system ATPase subunit